MKKKLVIISVLCSVYSLNTKAQSQLTILPGSPTGNARVGVNQFIPGNRLEINSFTGDPYFTTVNGSSGLRFTNLTSSNTPFYDSLNKVLSVDASGNVILVTDNGGSSSGNACGATSNPLTTNWEVPMAGYNYNYTMPANSASEFLIGLPNCTTSTARFGVSNDYYQMAGAFVNNYNGANSAGIYATVTNTIGKAIAVSGDATASGLTAVGGRFHSIGSVSSDNTGVNGFAANGTVWSIAADLDCQNSSSPLNIGHQTDITGGTNSSASNYGSQILINNIGSTNFGHFASVTGATTNYGVYATAYGGTTNWAGYFVGDLNVTGTYYNISDKRFKKNITKLENVTEKINKLNGYSYNFNTEEFKEKNFNKGQQIGLIAQEVKEIFPQLVKEDDKGYLTVNYLGMVPVLLEAIKEQQKQIDDLKKLVMANTNNPVNDQVSRMAINLNDKDVVVLNQNQPNPFAEQTTISYNIPQNAGVAQLVFYDASGRQIKSLDITTKGIGQLSVYANDLTNGMYSYTLIIDGKIIDTKKMVKQQ